MFRRQRGRGARVAVGSGGGRPGWIATRAGSTFSLEFETSYAGSLGLTFLRSYEGFSGARVSVDGKPGYYVSVPVGPSQELRKKPRNRPLPSKGVLEAHWKQPYSLPAMWVLRRLLPGRHVLIIELLPFRESTQNPGGLKSASSGARKRMTPKPTEAGAGKFKLLELASC